MPRHARASVRWARSLTGLLVLASYPLATQAQGRPSYCRSANDSSAYMLRMVSTYALATDSSAIAARDSLGIAGVASPTDVVLVTKESVCHRANREYQLAASGGTSTLSGRVYVVRAGTSYVVWDPAYRFDSAHPRFIYMVFDAHWKRRSIF